MASGLIKQWQRRQYFEASKVSCMKDIATLNRVSMLKQQRGMYALGKKVQISADEVKKIETNPSAARSGEPVSTDKRQQEIRNKKQSNVHNLRTHYQLNS